MSKKILIIDNFDSFTFNLADYFKRLDVEVLVYRNNITPEMVAEINPDAIVFSPGPGVPSEAGNLMAIIEAFKDSYPMLGVCLGHQAFIEAFGGSIKYVEPVHGEAYEIEHDGRQLFEGLPECFKAGRYHSLAADKVPECFEISARCGKLVMGIRHKDLPIEGIQFHPESVLTMKNGHGLKLIENFVKKYVGRNKLVEFLEDSIEGRLNVEQQEEFLNDFKISDASELADAVNYLQTKMPEVPEIAGAIDICGTGGSGLDRINTSTISAFILSACGVKIAKHGNKAASGRFGSFDLLEELGLTFDQSASELEDAFNITGLTFMYARNFHPVMKHFAEVRGRIKKPTFFNILGPLLSPVKVGRQIIGTAFKDQMMLIAETCKLLEKEHVAVVCADNGLDEVTLSGCTDVVELKDGKITEYVLKPEDFGVTAVEFSKISGGGRNLELAQEIIEGKCKSAHLDLVLINCAFALKFDGLVEDFKEGYNMAQKIVASGEAFEKLEKVRLMSKCSGVLLKILVNKVSEVKKRKKEVYAEISDRDFLEFLADSRKALIAEIKRKSPSSNCFKNSERPVGELAEIYEKGGATAISVVCDEKFFGGNLEFLTEVREATSEVPILCKDFVVAASQVKEARSYGADMILLIAAALTAQEMTECLELASKLGMHCICEVHNGEELQKVLDIDVDIIGINNRDLKTFEIDLGVTARLLEKIPRGKIVISESGISGMEEMIKLDKRVNAVLVGTALMKAADIEAKLAEFVDNRKMMLKICGIRSVEEAAFCQDLGVDFIGLNFAPESKRKIDVKTATQICQTACSIKKVGIFQNQSLGEVNKIADTVGLDFIQLSGDEDLEYATSCCKPVIKTVNIRSIADLEKANKFKANVKYLLFDGDTPGSGQTFNLEVLENYSDDFILAGGLNSGNIGEILKTLSPIAIDIASGAETNGVIDLGKIKDIHNLITL